MPKPKSDNPNHEGTRRDEDHEEISSSSSILRCNAGSGRGLSERFRRGGSASAMNEEGLGLGLPVAKAIVEAHKGRIEMASRPGQGTTVTVALPADREAKA